MDKSDKFMIYEKYLKDNYKLLKYLYNKYQIKYKKEKSLELNIKLIYILMLMKFIYYSYNFNKKKLIELHTKLISMYRNLKSINKMKLANKLKSISIVVAYYLKSKNKMINFYFNPSIKVNI